MRISTLLATLLSAAGLVSANIPLSDGEMTAALASPNGIELAMLSRPMWHFAIMRPAFFTEYQKTCYPSPALIPDANNSSSWVQHGSEPSKWPIAGADCGDSGPVGPGNPFPTYFTVSQCTENEVRVVYNLYFRHDGFSNLLIAKGHMHDWERLIVVWSRSAGSQWTRQKVLMGHHGGHEEKAWGELKNTFVHGEKDGGKDGRKGLEGMKAYVGWGKHPVFEERETGWRDTVSQGCGREYRSHDWWFMPEREDLIPSGKGTEWGERIRAFDWGSATGTPLAMEEKVCGVGDGGYIKC